MSCLCRAPVRRLATMPPTPSQTRALLLLPPPPSPLSYAALKAAYHPPLVTVLKELAQRPSLLEIAVPCPHLYGRLDEPRGPLYAATEPLIANVYKLITITASEEAIDGRHRRRGCSRDPGRLSEKWPNDGTHAQFDPRAANARPSHRHTHACPKLETLAQALLHRERSRRTTARELPLAFTDRCQRIACSWRHCKQRSSNV